MSKLLFLDWNNLLDRKKLSTSINNDEISIVSTDTVYGFLANITKKSFAKLKELKGDRSGKSFIILINSQEKLKHFIDVEELTTATKKIVDNCWPGPLTIIFKAKKNLSTFLKSKEETIAIRIPKHEGLLSILESFNGLFSTSANQSGKPIPKTHIEIDPKLLEKISFVVNGSTENKLPSTIIDCSTSKIKIVRLGAYSQKKIEKFYEN